MKRIARIAVIAVMLGAVLVGTFLLANAIAVASGLHLAQVLLIGLVVAFIVVTAILIEVTFSR